MSEVNAISRQNFYSDQDLENLRGNEKTSTNAAVNRVANHAGNGDTHTIHGHDRTEADVRAGHAEEVQKEWLVAGGFTGASQVGEHLIEHQLEKHGARLAFRAMAGMTLPAELIDFGLDMAKSVAADAKTGHERAEARTLEAMHAFILGNLNGLPQGYVDGQRARLSKDALEGSFVRNMSAQLGKNDNGMMAIMQLHCDQGMSAARAMFDAKTTPAEYLRANKELGQRYASDPAFKHGFDGLVYAREHGTYDAVVSELNARDARYDAHHVAWRA